MLLACLQELWALLASACSTLSGIPQSILEAKAEELRKKKEVQDQINVSCCCKPCMHSRQLAVTNSSRWICGTAAEYHCLGVSSCQDISCLHMQV